MKYAELSVEDRTFICNQIQFNELKKYLEMHPIETSEFYKGRIKKLSHERIVNLLVSNENRAIIADFMDEFIQNQLDTVQRDARRFVDEEHLNEQEALVHSLSNSIFASHITLYLSLTEVKHPESYCTLLETCVSMLKESRDNQMSVTSGGTANEKEIKEHYEEQIALLTEQQKKSEIQYEEKILEATSEWFRTQRELSAQTEELQRIKEKLSSAELAVADLKQQVDFYQNPPIPPLKYDHRSLCRVDDTGGGRIWLVRLADFADDTLMSFSIDKSKPRMFENRERIYHNNGPREHGYIGVWDWKTSPNYSDPEKDYVESEHCPEISPIEVVTLEGISDVDSIITELQIGFGYRPSMGRIMFSVYRGAGTYVGVLCSPGDLETEEEKVKLSESTYSLPLYEFSALNMISIEEKKYYRKIFLGPEKRRISIVDPLDIVKQTLIKRMTWQTAKQQGITKSDWRQINDFFKALETDDFYQSIMEACGCSLSDAHNYTAQFLEKAEDSINLADVDSRLLAMIAMNHPELRKKCMDLLTEEWELERRDAINRSNEEEAAIRNSISTLKTEQKRLLEENAQMSSALENADALIREREQLAEDVEKKVEARIVAAKKNAADFICEMAFAQYALPENKEMESSHAAKIGLVHGRTLDGEAPELLDNWQGALNAIYENMRDAGVAINYQYELSAYLYSCYLNHFPVLLAGPNGREIADALSAVLTGRLADYVDCAECQYRDASPIIDSLENSVLVCDHPFVSEWVGHLPDFSRKQNVFTVFVHPYKEDLCVEPVGIVNYMLPLLTEFFVDQSPTGDYYPCRWSDEYIDFAKPKLNHCHQKLFSQLQIAPIVRNKLQRVLTDLRSMSNTQKDDYDLVLCLAPLAYLSDRTDLLVEKLKDQNQRKLEVSPDIRDFIIQMLGNEE